MTAHDTSPHEHWCQQETVSQLRAAKQRLEEAASRHMQQQLPPGPASKLYCKAQPLPRHAAASAAAGPAKGPATPRITW